MKTLLNRRVLALGVLFSFAFALRFSFICKGPFHFDTLDLALASQKTLETFRLVYESHGSGFPLTVLCGAFSIFILKFFGITDPVFCVNFMSVTAGALGVLVLFFLVERLFDFRKAIYAAVLFACFAPHIAISTFGKSLTLSICFSLASAYYMLRFCKGGQRQHFLFSAAFLGFTMAARLPDILVAVPLCYLYFSFQPLSYERLRLFVVYGLIVLLVGSFWYGPLLLDKGLNPFVAVLTTKSEAAFLGFFSDLLLVAVGWMVDVFRPEGLLLAIAGFASLFFTSKKKEGVFLILWFVVLYLLYGNISSIGLRYLVIAWIPLIVAQGVFLGGVSGKRSLVCVFIVLLIATRQWVEYAPVFEFRHRYSLQREFAEWVAQKTKPDAVIIAMDERLFLNYYGKRQTIPHPITTNKYFMERYFDNNVDPLLEEGRDVYVISSNFFSYDRSKTFEKGITARYEMTLIGSHRNEDWHHALLVLHLFNEKLYQLKWKNRS